MDYKDRLRLEVIPAKEVEYGMVHKIVADIAIVYKYVIKEDEHSRMSAYITEKMLEDNGISKEDFFEWAGNTVAMFRPPKLESVSSLMAEFGEEEEDEKADSVFVATIGDGKFGAGAIFYPMFLEYAAFVLGQSFYVIPTSIHEMFVVPVTVVGSGDNVGFFKEVLESANKEISPEEFLSNTNFFYDADEKELVPL